MNAGFFYRKPPVGLCFSSQGRTACLLPCVSRGQFRARRRDCTLYLVPFNADSVGIFDTARRTRGLIVPMSHFPRASGSAFSPLG